MKVADEMNATRIRAGFNNEKALAERVGFPAALILMGVSIGPFCKFPFLQCYWKFLALLRVAVTVADRD